MDRDFIGSRSECLFNSELFHGGLRCVLELVYSFFAFSISSELSIGAEAVAINSNFLLPDLSQEDVLVVNSSPLALSARPSKWDCIIELLFCCLFMNFGAISASPNFVHF